MISTMSFFSFRYASHSAIRATQRGQSMTEYLVITALIAVASIALFSLFGTSLRAQVAGMANEISGTSSTANISSSRSAAAAATINAKTDRNMGTYDEGGTKNANTTR